MSSPTPTARVVSVLPPPPPVGHLPWPPTASCTERGLPTAPAGFPFPASPSAARSFSPASRAGNTRPPPPHRPLSGQAFPCSRLAPEAPRVPSLDGSRPCSPGCSHRLPGGRARPGPTPAASLRSSQHPPKGRPRRPAQGRDGLRLRPCAGARHSSCRPRGGPQSAARPSQEGRQVGRRGKAPCSSRGTKPSAGARKRSRTQNGEKQAWGSRKPKHRTAAAPRTKMAVQSPASANMAVPGKEEGQGGGVLRGGSDAAGSPAWLLAGGQYGAQAGGLGVGRCGGLLAWDVGWPWGCC